MENLKELLKNQKVLIADDETFILRIISRLVHEMGCQDVTLAKSGRECIGNLNPLTTLLILDFKMPDINGIEILKQIRTGETDAIYDLTVLLLTSSSDFNLVGSAMALDVDGFIVKPISYALLAKHLLKSFNSNKVNKTIPEYRKVDTHKVTTKLLKEIEGDKPVSDPSKPQAIPIDNLCSGMILAEEVYIGKEVFLEKHTELTNPLITKVINYNKFDVKRVLVYSESQKELLKEQLKEQAEKEEIKFQTQSLHLDNLLAGMILAENIQIGDETICTKNVPLTETLIQKLHDLNKFQLKEVTVFRPSYIKVDVDDLEAGMILAEDACSGNEIILKKDTELSERSMRRLKEISDLVKIKSVVIYNKD